MALRKAPGVWRWEQRGDKWWRVHDKLNISDGPYDFGRKGMMERETVTEIIEEGTRRGWTETAITEAIFEAHGVAVTWPPEESQDVVVLLVGNVVDGIAVYGPFMSSEDALVWAEENNLDEWHVANVESLN